MPLFTPIAWGQIRPGDTILARDGRRVLIRGRPTSTLIITRDGLFQVDPTAMALRIDATDSEAIVTLIAAFPDLKLVPQ